MNYNILVTGGGGYLGSVLVPELLRFGNSVTVLDSFMFGQNSLLENCANPNFNVVLGDCRDESLIRSLLKDKDFIIPLAALVGAPLCKRDLIGTVSTNRDAIISLVKLASKDQRIIFPTTNSGYGIGQKGIYCDENTPLNPISNYGKTKVEAEKAILDRGNAITYRLATVFGASPRMRIDLLVNDFTYRAVKDRFVVIFEGHFKRNYIHIRDVAKAFIFGIENFENMKNEPYNVGLSDANLSKLELCEKIKKFLPDFVFHESQIGEDPDKRDYIISNEKIEKKGYKTSRSIEDGIQELIKTYTILTNSKFSNV
jgi:nucleoside-diphosphate-sugar epimerase